MTLYFFDLRDHRGLVPDEEGTEFNNMEAVQEEAVHSLGGLARDTFGKSGRTGQMAIEVRDDLGPVMRVTFHCEILRKH